MDRNAVAWITIALVVIALALAFLRHYYAAWGIMAVEIGLLVYAVRRK